jgi:hypothetical protein
MRNVMEQTGRILNIKIQNTKQQQKNIHLTNGIFIIHPATMDFQTLILRRVIGKLFWKMFQRVLKTNFCNTQLSLSLA